MPLVSDPQEVAAVYQQAIDAEICLGNFCTANWYTTEAIIRSAYEFGQEHGLENVPIVVSATGTYDIEPQLVSYTHLKDSRLGMYKLIQDVELLVSSGSPYEGVQAMLHFDHGQPDVDAHLFDEAADYYATIMYDASHAPFEENIRMTREFVEKMEGRVLVEGAVTEIAQAVGGGVDAPLTTPDDAEKFYEETGVFLIVPDVGTEHRATSDAAHYNSKLVRQITKRVGKRIVLHGSSSLQDHHLPVLASDGIVKVNIWTIFEKIGGQAVAKFIVKNLAEILTRRDLEILQRDGWIGDKHLGSVVAGQPPNLDYLREEARRDVWQQAVVDRMKFYMKHFNYARWGQTENA